jgi:glyoxylase-like metal-dependent hydrolase (beta-lactamase superfamily II)
MSALLEDLGGGVWRWSLPHPEWRRTRERVNCYAIRDGGGTVLIDPLLDDEAAEALEGVVTGTVTIAVTIPYHVRSAERASRRWDARIVGHPDLAARLPGLKVHEGAPGITLHPLPRHKEKIVQVADTLSFGDRVVGARGGLRIWAQRRLTDQHLKLLREWLAPLTRLDVERVLTTHGEPVLSDGTGALAEALMAEPIAW